MEKVQPRRSLTRRAIMPTKYSSPPSGNKNNNNKKNLHTSFSPYARVKTIQSLLDLDDDVTSEIWWQKEDYEEFRKTVRIITRAMHQGGSEIWLQMGARTSSCTVPSDCESSTLESLSNSLEERKEAFDKGDPNAKREHEEMRRKWWHRLGHSRRGLEHIASIDEGRQRQATVRASIRAVLEEQRRQSISEQKDEASIRRVYMETTLWARDLALAAGASDEDAVRSNFDEASRKTREFYLQKRRRRRRRSDDKVAVDLSLSSERDHPTTRRRPSFKKDENNRHRLVVASTRSSWLDANTASQIRYRNTVVAKPQNKSSTPPASPREKKNDATTTSPNEPPKTTPLAKQAAGFCASGMEERTNMSAVLTGMGPLTSRVMLEGSANVVG